METTRFPSREAAQKKADSMINEISANCLAWFDAVSEEEAKRIYEEERHGKVTPEIVHQRRCKADHAYGDGTCGLERDLNALAGKN